jgi:hypothetical protein
MIQLSTNTVASVLGTVQLLDCLWESCWPFLPFLSFFSFFYFVGKSRVLYGLYDIAGLLHTDIAYLHHANLDTSLEV